MSSSHKKVQSKKDIAKELKHIKKQLWNAQHIGTNNEEAPSQLSKDVLVASELPPGDSPQSAKGGSLHEQLQASDRKLLEVTRQFGEYRLHTENLLLNKGAMINKLESMVNSSKSGETVSKQKYEAGVNRQHLLEQELVAAKKELSAMYAAQQFATDDSGSAVGPLFTREQQLAMSTENLEFQTALKRSKIEIEVLKRKLQLATDGKTEGPISISSVDDYATNPSPLMIQQLQATNELMVTKLHSMVGGTRLSSNTKNVTANCTGTIVEGASELMICQLQSTVKLLEDQIINERNKYTIELQKAKSQKPIIAAQDGELSSEVVIKHLESANQTLTVQLKEANIHLRNARAELLHNNINTLVIMDSPAAGGSISPVDSSGNNNKCHYRSSNSSLSPLARFVPLSIDRIPNSHLKEDGKDDDDDDDEDADYGLNRSRPASRGAMADNHSNKSLVGSSPPKVTSIALVATHRNNDSSGSSDDEKEDENGNGEAKQVIAKMAASVEDEVVLVPSTRHNKNSMPPPPLSQSHRPTPCTAAAPAAAPARRRMSGKGRGRGQGDSMVMKAAAAAARTTGALSARNVSADGFESDCFLDVASGGDKDQQQQQQHEEDEAQQHLIEYGHVYVENDNPSSSSSSSNIVAETSTGHTRVTLTPRQEIASEHTAAAGGGGAAAAGSSVENNSSAVDVQSAFELLRAHLARQYVQNEEAARCAYLLGIDNAFEQSMRMLRDHRDQQQQLHHHHNHQQHQQQQTGGGVGSMDEKPVALSPAAYPSAAPVPKQQNNTYFSSCDYHYNHNDNSSSGEDDANPLLYSRTLLVKPQQHGELPEAITTTKMSKAPSQEEVIMLETRVQQLRAEVVSVRAELLSLAQEVEDIQKSEEEDEEEETNSNSSNNNIIHNKGGRGHGKEATSASAVVAAAADAAAAAAEDSLVKSNEIINKLRAEIALLQDRLQLNSIEAKVAVIAVADDKEEAFSASPLLLQQLQAVVNLQSEKLLANSVRHIAPVQTIVETVERPSDESVEARLEALREEMNLQHLNELDILSEKYNVAAMQDKADALDEFHAAITQQHLEELDHLAAKWEVRMQEAVQRARQFVKEEMTETMRVSEQVERDLSAACAGAEQSAADANLKLELANDQIAELEAELAELKDSFVRADERNSLSLEALTRRLEEDHLEKLQSAVSEASAAAQERYENMLNETREQLAEMYEDRERTLLAEHEGALDIALATLEQAKDEEMASALNKQWEECENAKNTALDQQWTEGEERRIAAIEMLEIQQQKDVKQLRAELEAAHDEEVREQRAALEKAERAKINEIVTACRKVEAQSKMLIQGLEAELAATKQAIEENEERAAAQKEKALRLQAEQHDVQQQLALNEQARTHREDTEAIIRERDQNLANYSKERAERRKLHNKLQDLLGTIRVVCRVRPMSLLENRNNASGLTIIDFPPRTENILMLMRDTRFPQARTRYEYDRVFSPHASQQEVFDYVRPLCVSVLDGYNVCLFAYGQTGSGKTYTMEGGEAAEDNCTQQQKQKRKKKTVIKTKKRQQQLQHSSDNNGSTSNVSEEEEEKEDGEEEEDDDDDEGEIQPHDGVAPRAISELLVQASANSAAWQYEITMSMLQIYNESIQDLLVADPANSAYSSSMGGGVTAGSSSAASANREKLDVRKAPDGSNYIPGLSTYKISTMSQVRTLMRTGYANRAAGAHGMNDKSSRSHLLTTVIVKGTNKHDGGSSYGKLNLIDLAGSERLGKTDATGERLKEAQNINKSLSALGDVVDALAASGRRRSNVGGAAAGGGGSVSSSDPHVPYRNSKLTFLLADSLGGSSKVLTFVNVSPAEFNLNETVCSLNFASRCRGADLGSAKRQVSGGSSIAAATTSGGGTTSSSYTSENSALTIGDSESTGGGSGSGSGGGGGGGGGSVKRAPSPAAQGAGKRRGSGSGSGASSNTSTSMRR